MKNCLPSRAMSNQLPFADDLSAMLPLLWGEGRVRGKPATEFQSPLDWPETHRSSFRACTASLLAKVLIA